MEKYLLIHTILLYHLTSRMSSTTSKEDNGVPVEGRGYVMNPLQIAPFDTHSALLRMLQRYCQSVLPQN